MIWFHASSVLVVAVDMDVWPQWIVMLESLLSANILLSAYENRIPP
jgi:hypothetical protein